MCAIRLGGEAFVQRERRSPPEHLPIANREAPEFLESEEHCDFRDRRGRGVRATQHLMRHNHPLGLYVCDWWQISESFADVPYRSL
jgi:hypothetical protein